MKYTPILRRWSGYAPLNCRRAMPEAVSRAAKPFILTLDSVGGISMMINNYGQQSVACYSSIMLI